MALTDPCDMTWTMRQPPGGVGGPYSARASLGRDAGRVRRLEGRSALLTFKAVVPLHLRMQGYTVEWIHGSMARDRIRLLQCAEGAQMPQTFCVHHCACEVSATARADRKCRVHPGQDERSNASSGTGRPSVIWPSVQMQNAISIHIKLQPSEMADIQLMAHS